MKKNILWVDDEPAQIMDKVYYLQDSGFNVEIANGTKQCMSMLKKREYDLVIVDLLIVHSEEFNERETKSGSETGVVLSRWIRENYPNTKIVGCSIKSDETIKSWFNEFGSGFWLKGKMPESKILVDMVNNILFDRQMPLKIFIIHGRDNNLKLELKNYIQNSLKLGEPIVLHEQPSLGRTIIEKFEQETENVDLVFALLTPEDKVLVNTESNIFKRKARQNIIFELGYFYGKINRKSGRIILLYKNPLDLPSDISGIIYINIDNGISAAGEEIRRELVGYVNN